MLEQSFEHGTVYLSYVKSDSLITKSVKIPEIQFGPSRPVHIIVTDDFVYVQDLNTKIVYLYSGGHLQAQGLDIPMPDNRRFFYYYGMAYLPKAKTEVKHYPFFTQNRPPKQIDDIPNIQVFEPPRTLQNLGYRQTFTYPIELIDLLGDVKATYVDRYKRPIRTENGRTLPISMDRVSTKMKDLPESNYPIVVDLAKTPFAMVDLEPGYTDDDLEHFNSLDGYYVESTPRGGKHLLVPIQSDLFKFRYSDHLEIINEGMVTLYGIEADVLSLHPDTLDITPYTQTTRRATAPVKPVSDNIKQYVEALQAQSEKVASPAKHYARNRYEQESDRSYADYIALYILYMQDVYPYQHQLPENSLPWILEAYARDTIPWRSKHDSMRNGVPYMVHLANEVIQYNKDKDRKVEGFNGHN